eukprot:JZ552080.1.p1 GENE.JZ552080.1~~JZ552080.1.p1  ORF type:complete len:184 (+),score=55.10 JZ552080.1:35-586(+)
MGFFDSILNWFRSLFWKQEMEISLVGLNGAGKTTLVHVLAHGDFTQDSIPTLGFQMSKIQKGNVQIKMWDIGGQQRFRNMWERYCRGVNAIVFVVDAADVAHIEDAKKELRDLLEKPPLKEIPLLVLGNKNDLAEAVPVEQIRQLMELDTIVGREVCVYSISAKSKVNIDVTLDWLTKHAKKK